MAQGGPSKRNTQNSGVHASGVSSDVDPNIKESNRSSRSKDGKSTTRVRKKCDGGAPKDSKDIDASERANVGGEKEIEKPVELEDDVAKQVIMSDGASCENFANGEVPAADNLTDMDQNIQKPKRGSKLENGTGTTKVPKNCDSRVQKHSVVEKQVDGEDDIVKQRVTPDGTCENFANGDGGASGEQITGNGFGETERVSDGASAEKLKNRDDDNKSVDEMAETGNSGGEKESDSLKQVIMSGGASGEQIPNLHDDNKSVDENSQTGNGVGETEGVSDGTLAEPIKNRDDNKSVETGETAETGNNSVAEKDSDVVKQVIMYDCASGQHITNSDGDGSADERAEMVDGVCKKEVEVEGDLVKQAEQTKNRDDDNVMIGENIDESKANLDAMQRPNINSDLAVQEREIVGMSDLVEDKNNAIESSVIGIEKVEDDGDNIPTTGNRDRSSLQTIEEDEDEEKR